MTVLVTETLTEPVEIINGKIDITLRKYDFRLIAPVKLPDNKRTITKITKNSKRGRGAAYAREWIRENKTLPKRNKVVVEWWLQHENEDLLLKKEQLFNRYKITDMSMHSQAWSARISELVGVFMITPTYEYRIEPDDTRKAYRYRLNIPVVNEVLTHNWKLGCLYPLLEKQEEQGENA